jgi:hypothetical protein
MKRFRFMGVTLLAVFALGAVVASAAQAEEAPFWTVKGTRLEAGQTRFITAKEWSPFILSGGGITITCDKTSILPHGALLGSEPGEHGNIDLVSTFSECKVEGNEKTKGEKPECEKVEEPINTTSLSAEQVLDSKTKTKLLTLFQPATGSLLATLKFPKGCKFEETKVTGTVVGEDLNTKEEAITTSSTKEQADSWLIDFPKVQPVEVWLVKKGEGKEVENKALTAFGGASSLIGIALVLLAELNSNNELVSTKELWSPLP